MGSNLVKTWIGEIPLGQIRPDMARLGSIGLSYNRNISVQKLYFKKMCFHSSLYEFKNNANFVHINR